MAHFLYLLQTVLVRQHIIVQKNDRPAVRTLDLLPCRGRADAALFARDDTPRAGTDTAARKETDSIRVTRVNRVVRRHGFYFLRQAAVIPVPGTAPDDLIRLHDRIVIR